MLEVELLAAEHIGVGVDKDELISENMIKFVISANVEEKGR